MNKVDVMRCSVHVLCMLLPCCLAVLRPGCAGEAIPQAEMQALDRAIAREANVRSYILGDLVRLKQRLIRMQQNEAREVVDTPDRQAALQPLAAGDESPRRQLERLEAEAQAGGRPARRSLALYYLYLGDSEKALAEWRRMGGANESDLPFLLVSSYLELALGEYDTGRRHVEQALRLMDTRTSLVLSPPVFCLNVGGYRIYTPRPDGVILPGDDVLVYVEVEGVDFQAAGDGYECRLMFGLKLKSDLQGTVWTEANYGEYAPIFSGPVRDLHAALTWRVPNDLVPGRYHLHVEALEDSSKRRGENLVSFDVGKRDTNPEKRPTYGGYSQTDIDRAVNEAQARFGGGFGTGTSSSSSSSARPESEATKEFLEKQRFELLKEYERMQKADR